MKPIRLHLGTPYVFKCPFCGNLIVTSVLWGSGATHCKCNDEIIRFDYVSEETIKENQKKYRKLIEEYYKDEEDFNISDVLL